VTAAKSRQRHRRAKSAPRAAAHAPAKQSAPDAAERHDAKTSSGLVADLATAGTRQDAPVTEAEKAAENEHKKQEHRWPVRVLRSVWTWIGAATAGAVGTVIATVILPSPSPASPAPVLASRAQSSGAPITALIDPRGSVPCNSPRAVVRRPGPVGKSIYTGYTGQPPSGGWLNVLVQGDGGEPVTIESVTAKVISRQAEAPGAVLYSECQGYSPSHTYVRLDLRASRPTANNVPDPDPTGPATVVPLPIEVTGNSPAQFYIQPVSGATTVRWRLQIRWERGSHSGTVTGMVETGQSRAAKPSDAVITTVGTDGDTVLCPNGTGDTWAAVKGQSC
jgi:hypothetical protein